jgi:hypothetical protein
MPVAGPVQSQADGHLGRREDDAPRVRRPTRRRPAALPLCAKSESSKCRGFHEYGRFLSIGLPVLEVPVAA